VEPHSCCQCLSEWKPPGYYQGELLSFTTLLVLQKSPHLQEKHPTPKYSHSFFYYTCSVKLYLNKCLTEVGIRQSRGMLKWWKTQQIVHVVLLCNLGALSSMKAEMLKSAHPTCKVLPVGSLSQDCCMYDVIIIPTMISELWLSILWGLFVSLKLLLLI